MASLNEQMTSLLETEELPYADDASASIERTRGIPKSKAFYPVESIQKLESWNSGMKQEKLDAKIDENIQNAKEIGTGVFTGFAGLPSDILEGVNYINDFMAEQGSPKAIIFKDALNEAREKYGRAAFDKKFTEITGIKSDASNMNQIVGEILSPAGAFVATAKGSIKATQGAIKLYDFLKDKMVLQTKLLRGDIPPGGATQLVTGNVDNTATQLGNINQIKNKEIAAAAVDAAKTTKTVNSDNPNQPQINLNEIGLNTAAGRVAITTYRNAESLALGGKIGLDGKIIGGGYTKEGYEKLSLEAKNKLYIDTGVYRGSDGEFRYKISTADAQLNGHTLNEYGILEKDETLFFDAIIFNAKNIPTEGLTLREVLNHQDLYKQYPNDIANATKRTEYTKSVQYGLIENIKIKNFDTYIKEKNLNYEEAMARLKKTQAIYSRHEGVETIYIRSGKLADVRSVLLHEVQHAIQHREGFLAGASPQKFLYDPKTEFGQTYIANEKNIIASKNEALFAFESNIQLNKAYEKNKELLESVTDKLVKREYNTFTGNDRFLSRNNMLVEDVPKETYRGSGVYIDRKPKIYQGYDTSNVIFNKEEMDLANNLSRNKVFQDYIKKRIFIEKTVQEQKLMESEAHKLYIKEPGEMEAVKVQTDDQRYVLKLRKLGYTKGAVVPKDVQERIFRELKPGLLQGDVVPTVGTNANTSASIRK